MLIVNCCKVMRAHVLISGLVQGVGYRFFLRDKAEELGLTGWVKNRKDGRVEAVFQRYNGWREFETDKKKIEEMVALCKKGTVFSDVHHVEIKWDKFHDDLLTNFEIR